MNSAKFSKIIKKNMIKLEKFEVT